MPLSDVKAPKQAWNRPKNIKRILRPLLYCLKFTGLLHTVDVSQDSDPKDVPKPKRCCSVYKVYAIIVILILWYKFGFSLLSFRDATRFDGFVCNEIITSTWFFQVAGIAVNNYLKCNLWSDLFKKWDKISDDLKIDTEKTMKKCVITCHVWLICAFSFTTIGFILNPTLQSPIPGTSYDVAVVFRVVFVITYFYFVTTWYLLTSIFAIIAFGAYRVYQHYNKKLKDALVGNGKFVGEIEKYRLQHYTLTRFLGTADRMLSAYVFFTIGTIIPLIIITLYFVVFQTIDTFSYIATWWSVSLSMVQLTVVFIGGGLVNHVMSVFLNQLTSNPIGFTALGLFTIDRSTIIT
ncbi:hypothetical protein KUTeg_003456, partial [Tegillarca granosa]